MLTERMVIEVPAAIVTPVVKRFFCKAQRFLRPISCQIISFKNLIYRRFPYLRRLDLKLF